MSIRAISLVNRLLALASVVAFIVVTWHIMGLIEGQYENANRVAGQHDALQSMLTRAEKLENQLDTLEPNAAGVDLVAGERLTRLWNTDLSRLRCVQVTAEVTFRAIDADEASAYWNTGEPADKAGGYGIQGIGGIFARSINGSYSAVVGLPLMETEVLLREFGVDTWRYRNG